MRVLLFIHLVAVSFWLGSQLFLVAVLAPSLRSQDAADRRALFSRVGRLYGKVSMPVLLVILATGITMAARFELQVSGAFAAKLVSVAVVLVGTLVHAVAASRGAMRPSRIASVVTIVATIAAVWFATGI